MTLMVTFLIVAVVAWFALKAAAAKSGEAAHRERVQPPSADVENIDTDKFARLMAAPPTEKSIQQALHRGLVETGPGVWKTKAEAREEELEWQRWRATLTMIPIHVNGQTVTVKHGESSYLMQIESILASERNWCLDGFCPDLSDRRTFSTNRIESVTTADAVEFLSVTEWLVHRIKIAPSVADDLGLRIPPVAERR